jgi:DNA-directed RNA polymerase specialized sigma24 family protein
VPPEVVRAFLSSDETRRFVRSIVAPKVPPREVEDVMHDILAEATRSAERAPPSREAALRAWTASIARRGIAQATQRRKRRRKVEGPMAAEAPDTDAANPHVGAVHEPVDLSQEPHFAETAFDWLQREVARDPFDRETLEIQVERQRDGKTYQQIADERGVPLTSLSGRIFQFKTKYGPRYRARKRRGLYAFLITATAVVLAILLWYAQHQPERVAHPPPPPPRPALSP